MKQTKNYIIVFDLETDGLKAKEGVDNITQIGAVALDMSTLELDKENILNITVRPEDIEEEEYYNKHKYAIDLHSKWQKRPVNQIIDDWKQGVSENIALQRTKKWIAGYKQKDPLMFGGQNIKGFDLPILVEKYSKHKITGCPFGTEKKPLSGQRIWDLFDMTPKWFYFAQDCPSRYNMDSLREYFSMADDKAHDAEQDVLDEGELLIRFIKLYKHFSNKVQWR